MDSDIIKLNVGGSLKLATTRKVLCSVENSALEKMFNGLNSYKTIEDWIFVDRDCNIFEMLVNYLRNDRKFWPHFKIRED